MSGAAGGRDDLEMRVDDGAELVGHGEVGQQLLGRPGRHGEDHAILRRQRLLAIAEGQADHLAVFEFQGDAAGARDGSPRPPGTSAAGPDRRRPRPGSAWRRGAGSGCRPWRRSRASPRRQDRPMPSSGSVLSAETSTGRRNFSHSSPRHGSTSSIRRPGWRRIKVATAEIVAETRARHAAPRGRESTTGWARRSGAASSVRPVATSKNGNSARAGPTTRSSAPMARR